MPLDPVLDRAAGGPPIPARSIMLTFDDAYRDFAEAAWPVLGRLGIPATLFVPTAFPDTDRPFWWDRLYAALIHTARTQPIETAAGSLALADRADRAAAFRSLRSELKSLPHAAAMAEVDRLVADLGDPGVGSSVLGWDELRSLAADGVTLAPHSRVHPLLERIEPNVLPCPLLVAVAYCSPAPFASAHHKPVSSSHERSRRTCMRYRFSYEAAY